MQSENDIIVLKQEQYEKFLSEFIKGIDGKHKNEHYGRTRALSPVDLELLNVDIYKDGVEFLLYEKHEFEPGNRHKFIHFTGQIALNESDVVFIGAIKKLTADDNSIKAQDYGSDYEFSITQHLRPYQSHSHIRKELIYVANKLFANYDHQKKPNQSGCFKIIIDPTQHKITFPFIENKNLIDAIMVELEKANPEQFKNYILGQLPHTKLVELQELEQIHLMQIDNQFSISSDKEGAEIFTHGKLANILTKYIQDQKLKQEIRGQENSFKIKQGSIIVCSSKDLAQRIVQEIAKNTKNRNAEIELIKMSAYKPAKQTIAMATEKRSKSI